MKIGITFIIILSLVGGIAYTILNNDRTFENGAPTTLIDPSPSENVNNTKSVEIETTEESIETKQDSPVGNTLQQSDEPFQKEESTQQNLSFSGTILAGTTSPLIDFNSSDYQKAIASGKPIVLYFYADWCPLCKAEQPALFGAFNDIMHSEIIGFRVNFNDSFTDQNETELAREYGVSYQHTKVFIKNGNRVLKSPETWSKARYEQEFNLLIN